MKTLITIFISIIFISTCFTQQDLLPAFPNEISYRGDIAFFEGSPFTGILVEEKTNNKIGEFKNGYKNGEFTEYYTKDKKKFLGKFTNGIKEGNHTEWYENGNKKSESKYINGKKEGEEIYYHSNGKLKVTYKYSDGKIIIGTYPIYNEEGVAETNEIYEYAICKDCNGDGKPICYECSGKGKLSCQHCSNGKVTCNNCNGNGKINCNHPNNGGVKQRTTTFTKKCPKCDGTGSFPLNKKLVKCDYCNGVGRFPLVSECSMCDKNGKMNCPSCNGRGTITCAHCNGTSSITCNKCYGTGKSNTSCQSCGGTGKSSEIVMRDDDGEVKSEENYKDGNKDESFIQNNKSKKTNKSGNPKLPDPAKR